MVVASGIVRVNGEKNTDKIVNELKNRAMEISRVDSEKVHFLFNRDSIETVKNELDSIRMIENVRDVHLTYYSLE